MVFLGNCYKKSYVNRNGKNRRKRCAWEKKLAYFFYTYLSRIVSITMRDRIASVGCIRYITIWSKIRAAVPHAMLKHRTGVVMSYVFIRTFENVRLCKHSSFILFLFLSLTHLLSHFLSHFLSQSFLNLLTHFLSQSSFSFFLSTWHALYRTTHRFTLEKRSRKLKRLCDGPLATERCQALRFLSLDINEQVRTRLSRKEPNFSDGK